jgi:hypothetical protein
MSHALAYLAGLLTLPLLAYLFFCVIALLCWLHERRMS